MAETNLGDSHAPLATIEMREKAYDTSESLRTLVIFVVNF